MATAVGAIGLGSSLAGGLLSAFGAKKEGEAQSQMYAYQSQVAKINAQIDQQNKDWSLKQGAVESQQLGQKQGQQFAQIKVAQAASGLDVNSGSATEVQTSQRKLNTADLTQLQSNIAKTAFDYDVKTTADLNQSGLYTQASKNAEEAGKIKALASIIGTAGSVSSKWMQGNTMGMWGGGGGGGTNWAAVGNLAGSMG